MFQKQEAADLGVGDTNHNKMENDNREPSVNKLQQLAKLFNRSVDDVLNYKGKLLEEAKVEDKAGFEQISLIN